jgi:hypothetical protein
MLEVLFKKLFGFIKKQLLYLQKRIVATTNYRCEVYLRGRAAYFFF